MSDPDPAERAVLSTQADGIGGATTAAVFERLREALVDVMGTAAAATFLRRAIRKAAKRHPELATIAITKHRLDYEYVLPDLWSVGQGSLPVLADLSVELEGLLRELTGPVVVRRLRSVPLLADAGLFRGEELEHA